MSSHARSNSQTAFRKLFWIGISKRNSLELVSLVFRIAIEANASNPEYEKLNLAWNKITGDFVMSTSPCRKIRHDDSLPRQHSVYGRMHNTWQRQCSFCTFKSVLVGLAKKLKRERTLTGKPL